MENKEMVNDVVEVVDKVQVTTPEVKPASVGKVILVTGLCGIVASLTIAGAFKVAEIIKNKVKDIKEKNEIVEDYEIEE